MKETSVRSARLTGLYAAMLLDGLCVSGAALVVPLVREQYGADYALAGLLLACCWGKEYPMKIFLLLAGAFILFFIIYYWVLMPSDGLFVRIPFSEFTVNIHSDTARLSFPLRKQLPEYGAYTMIFGYWTLVSWVTGYFKLREKTLK